MVGHYGSGPGLTCPASASAEPFGIDRVRTMSPTPAFQIGQYAVFMDARRAHSLRPSTCRRLDQRCEHDNRHRI